jgi:diguanylate cyclase (GGDEF)-like protein
LSAALATAGAANTPAETIKAPAAAVHRRGNKEDFMRNSRGQASMRPGSEIVSFAPADNVVKQRSRNLPETLPGGSFQELTTPAVRAGAVLAAAPPPGGPERRPPARPPPYSERVRKTSDAHFAAVEDAYTLVELAQGQDDPARLAAAGSRAAANGWDDVLVVLDFARSLAAQHAGGDGSEAVRAMMERAAALGDPALFALARAAQAHRLTRGRRRVTGAESVAAQLVQAAALLDGADSLVVHRVAALIEVATVAHELGFWELAAELYETARTSDADARWARTAHRQRRVLAFNRIEMALDWASAHIQVNDWAAAGDRAAAALRDYRDEVDPDWPAPWVAEHRAHLRLLAAIAGSGPVPSPSATASSGAAPLASTTAIAGSGPVPLASTAATDVLDRAIRAARAGDDARAAGLAATVVDRLGAGVPGNTQLLTLHFAARHPGTPALAIRYAEELAALRWNNRIDRLAGIRAAITVEHARREHEQTRRQLLLDELTGLANRRGYHTYLDNAAETGGGGGFAVMMIDVDHFKKVNDTFGHDIGDAVLVRLGEILAAHVRPSDLAARLGGDEFLLIVADVTAEVTGQRAQALVDAVREEPWNRLAAGMSVSISVGAHHGGHQELPTLLTGADRHLYQAKTGGRGRLAGSFQELTGLTP